MATTAYYRTIVPNSHGGGTTYRDHVVNPATRAAAYAVAARIPGAYVQVSPNGVTGWEDDAPATAAPAPRTYTARRIAQRFYEHTACGDECTPGDEFNVDATPYAVDDDTLTYDSMSELVDAVRRDGVTFAASHDIWAADPDGSYVIDYATGAREAVSWHFDDMSPALLSRVIIPAVDAR